MKRRLSRKKRMAKMLGKLFILSYCVTVFGTISLIKGNLSGDKRYNPNWIMMKWKLKKWKAIIKECLSK